jgi:hypothetical protein
VTAVLVLGVLGLLAYGGLVLWRLGTKYERFDEFERAGFQVDRSWLNQKVYGNHAGVAFMHYLESADDDRPARFAVTIPTNAPTRFRVSRARLLNLVRSLFVERYKTGDVTFDEKYQVWGDSDYLRAAFDSANLLRIDTLLAGKCNALEKDLRRLTAWGRGSKYLPEEELRTIVEQLAALRLPSGPATVSQGSFWEFVKWRMWE